jgi:23S rRNA pseudouridine2605 synthase
MPRHGLARALSKLGYCSRSQAEILIAQKRVQLNGITQRNPETPVLLGKDQIAVDGQAISMESWVYLMLNKPRGLVTTRSDEKGRPTVYSCITDASLPFLSPVGRLDQASEGLLLFTNDTRWAAGITEPVRQLRKIYHVQVNSQPTMEACQQLMEGVSVDGDGERMRAATVKVLRLGEKNAWLEIGLEEGKNRQIRRLLQAMDMEVLRLIRIAIGSLKLGELAKGSWRHLTPEEVKMLS